MLVTFNGILTGATAATAAEEGATSLLDTGLTVDCCDPRLIVRVDELRGSRVCETGHLNCVQSKNRFAQVSNCVTHFDFQIAKLE